MALCFLNSRAPACMVWRASLVFVHVFTAQRLMSIGPPRFLVRSSCVAPVVPSRLDHGAEETFLAQEGGREEGRQEEGQAVGQAQREEARVEAPFPQAQVEEGRR